MAGTRRAAARLACLTLLGLAAAAPPAAQAGADVTWSQRCAITLHGAVKHLERNHPLTVHAYRRAGTFRRAWATTAAMDNFPHRVLASELRIGGGAAEAVGELLGMASGENVALVAQAINVLPGIGALDANRAPALLDRLHERGQ